MLFTWNERKWCEEIAIMKTPFKAKTFGNVHTQSCKRSVRIYFSVNRIIMGCTSEWFKKDKMEKKMLALFYMLVLLSSLIVNLNLQIVEYTATYYKRRQLLSKQLYSFNVFGVSRPTVSVVVRRVAHAITTFLGPKYIQLPVTEDAVKDKVENYFVNHSFPQCLGATDGTHIEIKQPLTNSSDYINRKSRSRNNN